MNGKKQLVISNLKKIKAELLKFKSSFELKVIPMIMGSGFLSSLYFTFFSTSFYREHKSVLSGRVNYKRSLSSIKESCILLRRNIHRLEKGLIMQPRRDVFASGYIDETVNCYSDAIQSNELCESEKKWATDVLAEYFNVVADVDEVRASRSNFNKIAKIENITSIPYKYSELPIAETTYEQLMVAFRRRRSVRWYQDRVVPRELIEKAVSAASLAPSACNRQPYNFRLTTDTDLASKVASIAMGTGGWSHSIPALIVVVGSLSAYPKERDRHVIYIDGALAAMQLMLALDSLGLSSCPINWPDIENLEKKMAKTLELKDYERPIMLISIGYADETGGIPYSDKKTNQVLVKEITK
jgi:nitroreductase